MKWEQEREALYMTYDQPALETITSDAQDYTARPGFLYNTVLKKILHENSFPQSEWFGKLDKFPVII